MSIVTPTLYTQEFLVGDESGRTGDCLRAAVATLIQEPPDRVPHFSEFADWIGGVRCYRDDLEFRWRRPDRSLFPVAGAEGEWVVGCGRSPRGHLHAVVVSATDGSLIHDPHPSRDGLVGDIGIIILRKRYDHPDIGSHDVAVRFPAQESNRTTRVLVTGPQDWRDALAVREEPRG